MTSKNSTTDDLAAVRGSFARTLRVLAAGVSVAMVLLSFGLFSVTSLIKTSSVNQRMIASAALAVVSAPIIELAIRIVLRRVSDAEAIADQRQARLDMERRHRDLESKVSDALEMAENEPEALLVLERTFSTVVPAAMTELLLADNSHAHLSRRAAGGTSGVPGCSVSSPQQCPAARRARTHRFLDSTEVNACPKLVDREGGPCSAVCIPVSVMGRTVGVIHSVSSVSTPIDDSTVHDLHAVANHAGTRLGMLRVMSETQLQAATDGLTGLLNRRAFENAFVQLRERSPHGTCVIVMADLDHFKAVNDTYGHETGDRALRVFADTLRKAVRSNDLIARRGGEEFSIALPHCDTTAAAEVLERARFQLQLAIRAAGLPTFTASFGVTPAFLAEDLDLLLARADAGLFEAKRAGRDRIVAFSAADLDDAAERDVLTVEAALD